MNCYSYIKNTEDIYLEDIKLNQNLYKSIFHNKVKDFGSGKELQLKDENGDKLIFNSMIDALNYMSKHGFEFVQAYAISVGGQNVYHYLLRRKTE